MNKSNLESKIDIKQVVNKVTLRGFHTAFLFGIGVYYLGNELVDHLQNNYELLGHTLNIGSVYISSRIGWFVGAHNVIPEYLKKRTKLDETKNLD